MTISAFEVKIDNTDRGTHSTKFFSSEWQAKQYFDKFKLTPGETIQLLRIIDKVLIKEK